VRSYEAYNYTVWEKCRVSESYRHRVIVTARVYSIKHRHNCSTTFTLI